MKKLMTILLVGMILLVTGCGGGQKAQETSKPKEIHIAYQNSSTLVLLSKAQKLYEKEFEKDGIKVVYDLYLSGPPMMEAFNAKKADFANTGDMPPVSGKAAGVDSAIIGRAGYLPVGKALLIRPDLGYTSVKDLKGAKIAVQVGSSAHHYLALLLEKNGMSLSDIQLVNLKASEQKEALMTGNVDAAAAWEPWVSTLALQNAGKVLADSSDGTKRYVSVFLGRTEFTTQYPEIAKRFMKVNAQASEFIKKNPAEATKLIAAESKMSEDVLHNIVYKMEWDVNITEEDKAAFLKIKDFMKSTGVLKKDFDIDNLFDLRYLPDGKK